MTDFKPDTVVSKESTSPHQTSHFLEPSSSVIWSDPAVRLSARGFVVRDNRQLVRVNEAEMREDKPRRSPATTGAPLVSRRTRRS